MARRPPADAGHHGDRQSVNEQPEQHRTTKGAAEPESRVNVGLPAAGKPL
jgi:hypothetical protein